MSAPLGSNTTVIGAGALQAWIRASEPSVDLQVTVSEVRPDGKETFVQSGWLRASLRKLDPEKSTKLEPVLASESATRSRCRRAVDQGDGAALLPGPRLPGRVADPGDDERGRRRPADLGVRRGEASGTAKVKVAHSDSMESALAALAATLPPDAAIAVIPEGPYVSPKPALPKWRFAEQWRTPTIKPSGTRRSLPAPDPARSALHRSRDTRWRPPLLPTYRGVPSA